jgi:uncharacterized membrane protein
MTIILTILYFVIGSILTYHWYRREYKEFEKYHVEDKYSETLLNLFISVILWPFFIKLY